MTNYHQSKLRAVEPILNGYICKTLLYLGLRDIVEEEAEAVLETKYLISLMFCLQVISAIIPTKSHQHNFPNRS